MKQDSFNSKTASFFEGLRKLCMTLLGFGLLAFAYLHHEEIQTFVAQKLNFGHMPVQTGGTGAVVQAANANVTSSDAMINEVAKSKN